ncbi:MAG: tyrosine-type recombinase/integrase [Lachnospiraceae bacterium]
MVTEQPQHSVSFCIFPTLQNTEIPLISNDLRFIFASLLLLALPITFHTMRHSFATLLAANGVDILTISRMLTHKSVKNTQIYAKVVDERAREASEVISLK